MQPMSPGNTIVTAVMALLLLSLPAGADTLRCGSRLVSRGDSLYRVRSVCGEPDDAVRRFEVWTSGRAATARDCGDSVDGPCSGFEELSTRIQFDEWIYDFGRNRLLHRLTFEQGSLTRVESIDGARGR